MTRNRKIEKEKNPPPKSVKPKGSVNFGRMEFINEIVRKTESQVSLGFQAVLGKSYTIICQVIGSPSVAYTEIQSQVGELEQSLQPTISLHSDPLQEE